MFIVLLKFSDNKAKAGAFMDGHKAWIQRGFAEGTFLVVEGLQRNAGGGILAHGMSRAALEAFVAEDPFVAEGVVAAEIHEIAPPAPTTGSPSSLPDAPDRRLSAGPRCTARQTRRIRTP